MKTKRKIENKLEAAVTAVEEYLLRHAPIGTTPKIYTYNDGGASKQRKYAGVMVSEVSFSCSTGGTSFMQVDVPWGIAICGQTERVILSLIENWSPDEKQEEFERLSYCFKPAEIKRTRGKYGVTK